MAAKRVHAAKLNLRLEKARLTKPPAILLDAMKAWADDNIALLRAQLGIEAFERDADETQLLAYSDQAFFKPHRDGLALVRSLTPDRRRHSNRKAAHHHCLISLSPTGNSHGRRFDHL